MTYKDREKQRENVRKAVERWRERNPEKTVLEKRWVGWDGESWGTKQHYQLLQNSDGLTLEGDPLTIRDVLPSLCYRQTDGKRNINCWFVGNFDWNSLFRYESREIQKSVFTKGLETWLDDYRIQIVPRKWTRIWHDGRCYSHYDVWGFFSATGSFLKNLEKWEIPIDPIIERGKAYRDNFPPGFPIKEYNLAECVALKALMEKFYEALKLAGYERLRRFHGAGAIASLILSECGAKEAKEGDFSWEGNAWSISEEVKKLGVAFEKFGLNDEFPSTMSTILQQQLRQHQGPNRNGDKILCHKRSMSYFGGRIELLQRGAFDRVYNYDINSAYPSATRDLPALNTAKWKVFSNFTERDLENYDQGLVEIKWKSKDKLDVMGPFPFRTDGVDIAKGYVIFPTLRQGGGFLHGIYHLVEVKEALAKPDRKWDIRLTGNAWVIEEAKDYPFKRIGELLAHRLKLKAEKNAGAEPLKLGLNSVYGKFAERPKRYVPTYTELFYAGYITAWTRSQLLKYAKPESTILLCTDGIYSTEKLDCPLSPNAGDWEFEEGRGRFILAGLYQFNGKTKTRGYPKIDFDKAYASVQKKGTFSVKDRLFVSIKKSLAQSKRYPHTGFYDISRKLDWNQNEKRWLWTTKGSVQDSFPTRTVQETSYPYDWRDADEIAEKKTEDVSATYEA